MALTRAGAKDGTDTGSRLDLRGYSQCTPRDRGRPAGLDRGPYEEDDLMAGAGGFYLASNRIAQAPSATSNNEPPICSGPIFGA